MPSSVQRSFAGGEIAPSLYARSDQVKYQTGLRKCENFLVMRHGGVSNRPGTKFITQTKDAARKVRLIKFVFNADQTYVLEFGQGYIRFIRNGVQLTNANGTPYEVATSYQEQHLRDIQYVQSADVVTLVHPNYPPSTLSRSGHTNWTLSTITYAPSISAPASVSISGTAGSTSSYVVTSVKELTYEESLPSNAVGNTNTATSSATNTITIGAVKGIYEFNVYKRNNGVYGYIGTTVPTEDKMVRSYNRLASSVVIAMPTGHGYVAGNSVALADVSNSLDAALAGTRTISAVSANSITVPYTHTLGTGNNVGTIKVGCRFTRSSTTITIAIPDGHEFNTGEPLVLSGATDANLNGTFSVSASAASTVSLTSSAVTATVGSVIVSMNSTFIDTGIAPDATDTAPQARNPFPTPGNYPGTVSYFQQRSVFAATTNEPEKVWLSRIGNFKNFTIRSPLQDDDAVTFTIAGRQVNEVRHLVEIGQMLILTSGGEWRVMGDADGVIKPSAINLKQEGYSGSSKIPPIVIGNNALYIQARGNVTRDLRYDLQTDGYNGRDLTVFAAHMFDGFQLTTWDYAQVPHSIVWVVRDDGVLLGLTYVREHDVWGWHRHITQGTFEDVVCVPEGSEDAVYVVVRRYINGQWLRYIERFSPRYTSQSIDVKRDAFFVDCGATYDGINLTSKTLTVTANTGLTVRDTQTLTASASQFNVFDVGNQYELSVNGTLIRFKVLEYLSATQVRVQAAKDVPAGFAGVATASWTKMIDNLFGLDHLEGMQVTILADGNVHPARTVIEGAITLDRAYGVVHVGLGYTSKLQTLTVDNPGGETLTDKNKIINKVAMLVESSRGVFAGPDEEHLREYKQRREENYDEPNRPHTGLVEIHTVAQWDKLGLVTVVQKDPLPLSILSVVPQVSVSPR